jgi:hypothetical protein
MLTDLMPGGSAFEWTWIAVSIVLMGMAKGGFPVGPVALPLLLLVWPPEADRSRGAIAFMLPVLCVMDLTGVACYWRHVQWRRLAALLPGSLVGIAIGSVLFVSDEHAGWAVSDTVLRRCVGGVGLLFVLWQFIRSRVLKRLASAWTPGRGWSWLFGTTAGVTSTLAHAAGPIIQMYLLPQKLPKMEFAATGIAYFFVINALKLLPFGLLGRITEGTLRQGILALPLIPFGVLAGYLIVRRFQERHYTRFIQAVLLLTSLVLLFKS